MSSSITRVTAAVICKSDRFLICQRPQHKRHGGLWEFPGGKCEAGESDEDAMRRELREELAVEVEGVGPPLFESRDPGSVFLIAFVSVDIVGSPTLVEHTAIHWASISDLTTLSLAPSDRRFVEEYLLPPSLHLR